MGMPKIKCHGECKRMKDIQLFSPGQAKSKYPICRKCQKAANDRRSVARYIPADKQYQFSGNSLFFPKRKD